VRRFPALLEPCGTKRRGGTTDLQLQVTATAAKTTKPTSRLEITVPIVGVMR
jgi:hypothetical protein